LPFFTHRQKVADPMPSSSIASFGRYKGSALSTIIFGMIVNFIISEMSLSNTLPCIWNIYFEGDPDSWETKGDFEKPRSGGHVISVCGGRVDTPQRVPWRW